MDELTLGALYLIMFFLAIATSICFFVLCHNVSEIKKAIVSDFQEYKFQKKIGNFDKASYHLQRDFILSIHANKLDNRDYYNLFKELGTIPDFPEFEPYKEEDLK